MEFLNFKKYKSKFELESICKELAKNNIEYQVDDNSNSLDSNFGNTIHNSDLILKIRQDDFIKASKIVEDYFENKLIPDVNEEHFLFDFSDEELKDVLKKKDEWGEENYIISRKILKDRGIDFSEEDLKNIAEDRIVELSKPEEKQNLWIIAGYIFAFIGGFLGLFIGFHLSNYKKTLPNGEKVFNYSENDRKQGKRIVFISILSAIIWFSVKLINFLD